MIITNVYVEHVENIAIKLLQYGQNMVMSLSLSKFLLSPSTHQIFLTYFKNYIWCKHQTKNSLKKHTVK